MKNVVFALMILSVILIAGCAKSGITGRAVLENSQSTIPATSIETTETTSSVLSQYQINQKDCQDGVWRTQLLPNGTVKSFCNREIKGEMCDDDTSCGRDARCVGGFCRPI